MMTTSLMIKFVGNTSWENYGRTSSSEFSVVIKGNVQDVGMRGGGILSL